MEERKRIVIIANKSIETNIPNAINDFSFLIISGFLNRFNKIIQARENSKKCENYS